MSRKSIEKVYFFLDPLTLEVKIGMTFGNPKDRLRSLRCGNPRLEMIGHVDGKESQFHERFAKQRTSGEFFKLDGPVFEFLKAEFPTFSFPTTPQLPQDEFGYDFDQIIETGKPAYEAFVRNFDLDIEECVECGRGCECDERILRDVCRLTDENFISRIGFIKEKKSAFLFCKSWSSNRRRELLELVGSLASWVCLFDLYAIGSEYHDDSSAQVWHLNRFRIPPIGIKQFWIEFKKPYVSPPEIEEKYFQQAVAGVKQ